MPALFFWVHGMRGADDEERVEAALRAEPGVLGAVASHEDSCAEIDYEDDEVAIDRLLDLIRETGFPAELGG